MRTEDAYLVTLLKREQSEGFKSVSLTYGPQIYSLVRVVTGNDEDAKEVTSDALMQVFRSINSFEPEKGSLKSWILKIAYNCAVTKVRKRKQVPKMMDLAESAIPASDETEDDAAELVKSAIMRCSDSERQLIHLYYYDELPLAEIEGIMGVAAATLAVRLQRLRQKLKIIIQNHGR